MKAAHPRLLARLGLVFDRVVRFEKQGSGQNATGQLTASYSVVAGLENIPGQRIDLPGEEIILPGGTKAVARYQWALQGAYQINLAHQLMELNDNGQPTGVVHAVYQADVDPLGITTIKTAQVKR